MILSVSQRCDIPAFFSEWFYNRLQAGFVDVRSPYNERIVSRIDLNRENIDCIVFLSKNPTPMLKRIQELKDYCVCFQISLTPYHTQIEPGILNKREVIDSFKTLSNLLGKEHMQLRYDPIFLNEDYTIEYHERAFKKLLDELHEYCDTVIFSYIDLYKNTKLNQDVLKIKEMSYEEMLEIAKRLSNIASQHGLILQTCGEDMDVAHLGIQQGSCITAQLLEKLSGKKLSLPLRKSRKCGCVESLDIGAYNCCKHKCKYCYANYDEKMIDQRMKDHDPYSSLISGSVSEEDTIVIKKLKKVKQLQLL